MGHATLPDEAFEITSNKLRSIIRDDPRSGLGKLFSGPLDDDLNIHFGHLFPDLLVHNVATVTIQQAAQVVKGATDIQIGNIHVPMLMGPKRLIKALAFGRSRS